jgi:hypothetical protein
MKRALEEMFLWPSMLLIILFNESFYAFSFFSGRT